MLYKDGRIKGVQDTLDGAVAAGLITNPWRVTALPTIPSTGAALASITLTSYPACMGASNTALAADTTLQTIVDITGSGYVDFVLGQCTTTTASSMRLVLTVDGVAVADVTSVSNTTAWRLLTLLGEYSSGSEFMAGGVPIYFRSSLKIQAQQTAVSGMRLFARYRLAAPYTA